MDWKPVIKEYLPSREIVFEDGSVLNEVDTIIYCTGYKPSFPFWNSRANGGPLWNYGQNRLVRSYQHTFFRDHSTLGCIGVPRVLTFRSFEYQAIALARLFARRNAMPLPSKAEQEQWERERWDLVNRKHRRFHDILWDTGETMEWLRGLYDFACLPSLEGRGRCPPVLDDETRWAIEHVKKYPESVPPRRESEERQEDWDFVDHQERKDVLAFV